MNCPTCQTPNPPGARYCFHCGAALTGTRQCANCGSDLTAGARFCQNCGQALENPSANDEIRFTRLTAGAPREIADKMRAAHLSGERKIVTCLFADVVGSTQLAGGVDPDDWAEIMNEAFDRLSPAIYRYEGTIARLMGDALLAFFGAPLAHEDDPERAVRAALDLVRAAAEFDAVTRSRYGIPFAVRVGLNTGPVVVGDVGSDLKFEYTAMGDAVNLAARMQTAAQPMKVLISGDTCRYVESLFDLADLGRIQVKGKADPVAAYEVLNARAGQAAKHGLVSPLVGRAAELASLLSATDGRTGGAVVILAEAGVGKSRLTAEWRRTVSAQVAWRWTETRCLSYGRNLPYHALSGWLRALLGVGADAETDAQWAALKTILAEVNLGGLWPALAHLLTPGAAHPELAAVHSADPQALQALYAESLRQLMAGLAGRRPLVVMVEDLQWADPSSAEILAQLLPLAAGAPILFCFASRPEPASPGWRLIELARAQGRMLADLNLAPLSPADSQALISNLLDMRQPPPFLQTLVAGRAEGNPLFVEEVLRALIDRGLLVRGAEGWAAGGTAAAAALPDSLQGLLTARIDRLADDLRRTLRVASVLGRQFSLAALAEVIGRAPDLNPLVEAGLLVVEAGEGAGQFRHALIQEAAYRSLVKQDRRGLHLRVGEALERLYPERKHTREMAPVLGEHFLAGGDDRRALAYLSVAADTAARAYANAEAISHYTSAIGAALRLPECDGRQVTELFQNRGRTQEISSLLEAALDNYAELKALALERGDQAMLLAAVMGRAALRSVANRVHDSAESWARLRQARELAAALNDREAEAKVLWNCMLLNALDGGDLRERLAFGEQALALARQLESRVQLAFTLHDLWYPYSTLDQPEQAVRVLQEAEGLWRELGNYPMLSECVGRLAITHMFTGDYAAAEKRLAQARDYGQASHNADSESTALGTTGGIHIDQGEYGRALVSLEEAVRLARPISNVSAMAIGQSDLAWVYSLSGDLPGGLAWARSALDFSEAYFPIIRPIPAAMLLRLLVQAGDLAEANRLAASLQDFRELKPQVGFYPAAWISPALASAEWALARRSFTEALELSDALLAALGAGGWRAYVADALLLKARALEALGQSGPAFDAAREAGQAAESISGKRALWPALSLQAEWLQAGGRPAEAAAARQSAARVIDYIAGRFHTPEWRMLFLSQLAVKAVLAG